MAKPKAERLEVTIRKTWFDYLKAAFWVFIILALFGSFFGESATNFAFSSGYQEIVLDEEMDMANLSNIDFESTEKLGLLKLEGVLMDDGGTNTFGAEGIITPSQVKTQLSFIESNSNLKGLILEINSPGGTVTASDEIAYLIKKFRQKMPIFVYTKGMMASGGYYVGVNADKIYAHKQAIIGSIGVIYQIANFEKLAKEKIGVSIETYKAGKYKDMNSPFRSRTEEEKKMLQNIVDNGYKDFIEIIRENRIFSDEEINTLAQGQVWSGKEAVENKIIDKTAYFDEFLQDIKKELKLENSILIVGYSKPVSIFEELALLSYSFVSDPYIKQL